MIFSKFKKFFSLLIIALFLNACPSSMVNKVDQFEKRIKDRGKLKVQYSTGRTKFEKLKNDSTFNSKLADFKKESLPQNIEQIESADSSLKEMIDLNILKIDTKKYPDSVSIYVSVVDGKGNHITGLGEPFISKGETKKYWKSVSDYCTSDYKVTDQIKVEEIRYADAPQTAVNYLLDYSGSMPGALISTFRDAARKMINHTREGDFVGFTKFGSTYLHEVPLMQDLERAKAIMKADSAKDVEGGTEIFPPLMDILDTLEVNNSEQKIVVLFTDGQFGLKSVSIGFNSQTGYSSDYRYEGIYADSLGRAMLTKAQKSGIKIYTISYLLQESDIESLEAVANETGGKHYPIKSKKEIPYVFAEIYMSMNNYYKITYSPINCDGFHDVDLLVEFPEFDLPPIKAKGNYMIPIPKKEQLSFDLDILFETGSAEINPESFDQLKKLAIELNKNPTYDVVITGHTDDVGSENDNLILSEQRAKAVMLKLINYGILGSRIKSEGVGESEHIAPNDSEENRRINRRTEVRLIKK